MNKIFISHLKHTWLIDIDGTILKHNGHKHGKDTLLLGVKEFWNQIPKQDKIILLSARTTEEMQSTLNFLSIHDLRYDHAIFGLPTGERILINDTKPLGLETALSVNLARDLGLSNLVIEITDD